MTEQMVTDFPKDIRVLVGFIQGLTDHLAHWDKSQWASAVLGRSDVSLHTSPAFLFASLLFCHYHQSTGLKFQNVTTFTGKFKLAAMYKPLSLTILPYHSWF